MLSLLDAHFPLIQALSFWSRVLDWLHAVSAVLSRLIFVTPQVSPRILQSFFIEERFLPLSTCFCLEGPLRHWQMLAN